MHVRHIRDNFVSLVLACMACVLYAHVYRVIHGRKDVYTYMDSMDGLTCCVQMVRWTLIHRATCRCPSRDIHCQQSHPFLRGKRSEYYMIMWWGAGLDSAIHGASKCFCCISHHGLSQWQQFREGRRGVTNVYVNTNQRSTTDIYVVAQFLFGGEGGGLYCRANYFGTVHILEWFIFSSHT